MLNLRRYLGVGLLHIPCYGLIAVIVKLKHMWLLDPFQTPIRVWCAVKSAYIQWENNDHVTRRVSILSMHSCLIHLCELRCIDSNLVHAHRVMAFISILPCKIRNMKLTKYINQKTQCSAELNDSGSDVGDALLQIWFVASGGSSAVNLIKEAWRG